MGLNVIQLADRLRTEADAYEFVEQMRWGDNEPVCPHCGHEGATFLTPANGTARRTRTGTMSQRRVWKCHSCRKQFSVITGTCMHGTKIALRIWVLVIFEMCASKNGVAAREIERKYGVCSRTAWFLMHRIREAMGNDGVLDMLRGVVVVDETQIGGSFTKMNKRTRGRSDGERVKPGDRLGTHATKTIVLSLIEAETGEVRSRVIPDVTGATLRKALAEQVDLPAATLYTDEWSGYRAVGREVAAHETVNHEQEQYARYVGGAVITTNAAENLFSQLKRSIDGTHHHVSREHLSRYLAEFDYRHSTRKITDETRFNNLMGRVGGCRLTYKRVTA